MAKSIKRLKASILAIDYERLHKVAFFIPGFKIVL